MQTLAETLKAQFLAQFPNGRVTIRNGALSNEVKYVSFYLIGNDEDQPNNIRDNDPLSLMISLEEDTKGFTIRYHRNSVATKPSNPYHAMGSTKIVARKSSGDANTIARRFATTVERVAETLASVDLYHNVPEKYRTW